MLTFLSMFMPLCELGIDFIDLVIRTCSVKNDLVIHLLVLQFSGDSRSLAAMTMSS